MPNDERGLIMGNVPAGDRLLTRPCGQSEPTAGALGAPKLDASFDDEAAFRLLVGSPAVSAFRDAFQSATGLPVVLGGRRLIDWGNGRVCTEICPLLKNGHPDCAGCLRFPESHASAGALTQRCSFGLWRSAVPLHVNGTITAFLWTGWIVHSRPASASSNVESWEPECVPGCRDQIAAAHVNARVVTPDEYRAMVSMLAAFAATVHPFTCSAHASPHPGRSVAIDRATRIIAEEYGHTLELRSVARRCSVTGSYFSGLFRRSMGTTFTEYVARYRVEKAKELLRASRLPVGEIVTACGFGSHSQFNRVFHRFAGTSPRVFRAAHQTAPNRFGRDAVSRTVSGD